MHVHLCMYVCALMLMLVCLCVCMRADNGECVRSSVCVSVNLLREIISSNVHRPDSLHAGSIFRCGHVWRSHLVKPNLMPAQS